MSFNQNDNTFSPSVYSGISLFNPLSKIDKTMLTFSMWKTTLKISIVPAIETEAMDNTPKYDYKNSISIYLTPIKAHLFAKILMAFKENPTKYTNYGISTPQSIITVDTPKTFGKDYPGTIISIRKVGETGTVEASYSYECSSENFSAVVGFNAKNPKEFTQDSEIFKNEEIDAIINQLEMYYKAMTNAQSFATLNVLYPYLDKLASKMGVDLSNSNKRPSGGGFFTNQNTYMNANANVTLGQMSPQQNMYDGGQLQSLVSG